MCADSRAMFLTLMQRITEAQFSQITLSQLSTIFYVADIGKKRTYYLAQTYEIFLKSYLFWISDQGSHNLSFFVKSYRRPIGLDNSLKKLSNQGHSVTFPPDSPGSVGTFPRYMHIRGRVMGLSQCTS